MREQQVRFCTSRDGARIAFAAMGSGPALVKSANWLTHLELDRRSPLWRHWLDALSDGRTLVRYDGRGYGLSDREPPSLTLDAMVDDFAAVVDAAGLERFPVLGFCHGGPIAMAYAVRHHERVSALVLCGTYAQGRARRDPSGRDRAERELLLKLIEVGWGQEHSAFRQVFAAKAIPDGRPEHFADYTELQRRAVSAETAIRLQEQVWDIDVLELVPRIACPTLVLHATGDIVVPFEQGRLLAGMIPGARLVALASRNHDLLDHEPAWGVFVAETRTFLAAHDAPAARLPAFGELTPRERAILHAVAQGLDNDEIAARLHVSEKTVRNNITSIFGKLGVASRNRAIVVAREAGYGLAGPPPQ